MWPWRPEPLPDELLSSWLRRVALGNSPKVHTFCNAVWPGLQIWNRDIDCLAPEVLLEALALGTGQPTSRVRQTTFGSLEGVLFEQVRVTGPTEWVLPVGVYHRTRRRPAPSTVLCLWIAVTNAPRRHHRIGELIRYAIGVLPTAASIPSSWLTPGRSSSKIGLPPSSIT